VLNVLSLGAGVQSSTLALMAVHGEVEPMPDCAIFADTGDEPKAVYEWLRWLETQLPFPVYHVSKGILSEDCLKLKTAANGNIYTPAEIPAQLSLAGDGKKVGIQRRGCTQDYKIIPIRRKLRELVGLKRATKNTPVLVSQWIGISTDEIARIKPSRDSWVENRWPLVEKRINRQECLKWLEDNGYPTAPRSACIYCPFHDDKEWLHIKTTDPKGFQKAVTFERQYQDAISKTTMMSDRVPYFHRSRVPLDEVDFDPDRDQFDMFDHECEGMCGV